MNNPAILLPMLSPAAADDDGTYYGVESPATHAGQIEGADPNVNSEHLAEGELVARAARDSAALAELYTVHYRAIYGYVARRVGNEHDSHDVVAEVFLSMVRYLPRYEQRGVPFRVWLLRLANTQIGRWARRRRRQQFWCSLLGNEASSASDSSQDEMDEVRGALLGLPARVQEVVSLKYFANLSIEEIATALSCKAGTVKSRLSRGREMLRARLAKTKEKHTDER